MVRGWLAWIEALVRCRGNGAAPGRAVRNDRAPPAAVGLEVDRVVSPSFHIEHQHVEGQADLPGPEVVSQGEDVGVRTLPGAA